jgi:hypothetical protein
MKHAWTKLVAVATLVAIVTTAHVGAVEVEVRPDKNLTGGSVRTGDRDAACGHSKENRHPLPPKIRDEILTRYKLPPGTHPDYEIDHLIPLCLGGADDPSNLWPQPRRSKEETWNAEAKDRLEDLMCKMVCNRQIDIAIAQEARPTGSRHIRNTSSGGKEDGRGTTPTDFQPKRRLSPLPHRYGCVGHFDFKNIPLQRNQFLRKHRERRIHV